MDSNKTFIKLGQELLLMGKDDDQELFLFDPSIHCLLQRIEEGGKFGSRKIVFSHKFEHMITQSYSKSILSFWNMNEKKPFVKSGTQEKLETLTLTKDGVLCLGGSINGFVFIWNACSGEILTRFQVSTKPIFKLLISSTDMVLIVVSSDAKVSIYDLDAIRYQLMSKERVLSDFTPNNIIFAHQKPVTVAALPSNNDTYLMTASSDSTVKVWDLRSTEIHRIFAFSEKITAACFDNLGLDLFVGLFSGSVYRCSIGGLVNNVILDQEEENKVRFGSKVSELKTLLAVKHKDYVSAMAYLTDSRQLVTAGADLDVNFSDCDGKVVHTNFNFKKKINYIYVIKRPFSMYESSLHTTRSQRKHQSYASFQKVKNIAERRQAEFPLADTTRKQLKTAPLSKMFVDSLLNAVLSNPEPQDTKPILQSKQEDSKKDAEIKVMQERMEKLLNMNMKLLEQLEASKSG